MKSLRSVIILLAIICIMLCCLFYLLFAAPHGDTPATGKDNGIVQRIRLKDSNTEVIFHGSGSGTNARWYLTTSKGKAIPEKEATKIMKDNFEAQGLPFPPVHTGT